jgi:uncharacterized repeat protein (TIGR01451 family)
MMFKKFKKIIKIASALGVVALLAGQVLSAPLKTTALQPRFNFLENDKELLTGLNFTKNETVYTDPVSGDAGDQIVGLIYYHNGVENTVATNTTFRLSLPDRTNSTEKLLRATISADNAEPQTISDTIVNNQIVGKSGLTVSVPTADSEVEFVPGSVRWFPNKSETPVELPAGVNGNDLITSGGLNIGDVNGCWQYSGYIAFGLRIKTPIHPVALAIDKTVRNETLDQGFVKANEARPGDILTYKIIVRNTGESNANQVTIKDFLPPHVTLLPETIHLYLRGSETESPFPGGSGMIGDGASIGELPVGESMFTKVIFSVKVDESGLDNGQVLVNRAEAYYQALKVADQAQTTIVITAPIFTQAKSAFNETQGIDATKVLAKPGDVIRYSLKTQNVGTAAGLYVVRDGIADILEYADPISSRLGGGTIIERPNATNEDNRIQIIYPEVSIAAGDGLIAEFAVVVKNPLPTNPQSGHHYDYTMFNKYGNSVVVRIKPPVIVLPELTIVKDVRDVTSNEQSFNDKNSATAGDTLEYRLTITNSTSVPADGVKIIDTLPANVVYIPGTTVLSANGTSMTLVDGITGSGITLPQIPANSVYTIYLRAKIDAGVANSSCLVNTGTATSGSINVSDQATSCLKTPETPVTPTTVTPSPNLPVTGTGGVLGTIFGTFFAISNLIYFSGKKKILALATSLAS